MMFMYQMDVKLWKSTSLLDSYTIINQIRDKELASSLHKLNESDF